MTYIGRLQTTTGKYAVFVDGVENRLGFVGTRDSDEWPDPQDLEQRKFFDLFNACNLLFAHTGQEIVGRDGCGKRRSVGKLVEFISDVEQRMTSDEIKEVLMLWCRKELRKPGRLLPKICYVALSDDIVAKLFDGPESICRFMLEEFGDEELNVTVSCQGGSPENIGRWSFQFFEGHEVYVEFGKRRQNEIGK